jgi:DNA-binding XRE family transcriptional regulator
VYVSPTSVKRPRRSKGRRSAPRRYVLDSAPPDNGSGEQHSSRPSLGHKSGAHQRRKDRCSTPRQANQPDYRVLGLETAHARRTRRWTIESLAKRAGASAPTMGKVERGDPQLPSEPCLRWPRSSVSRCSPLTERDFTIWSSKGELVLPSCHHASATAVFRSTMTFESAAAEVNEAYLWVWRSHCRRVHRRCRSRRLRRTTI